MKSAEPVLLTGAAGRVGSTIRQHLRGRHDLRLFDLVEPQEPPQAGEELMLGDISQPDEVARALEGVGAVVHLACVHGYEIDFESTLDPNYRAVLALLEGAANNHIGRFVYASSHHVLGAYRREGFEHTADTPIDMAPDAYYGLSKAFGELACAMYSMRYDMRTFVIRIGNANPTVGDDRNLRMWVSARDLSNLIDLGLTSTSYQHEVVYGTSICPEPLFDNGRALELGYEPRDRALDHLDPNFVEYDAMPPEVGREWIGGPYVAAPLPSVFKRK